MFAFRLDARSGVPTYLQLVKQVRRALLIGYLRSGDRLPTVREVAAALVVNPNTVVKAYRDLEQAGLVTARAGQGTFITGTLKPIPPPSYTRLSRSLHTWLRGARNAGLDAEQIGALVAAVIDDSEAEGGAA